MRMARLSLVAVLLVVLVRPAAAATFQVEDVADTPDLTPGDGACADPSGLCTLRAAVMEANALPGRDAIRLAAGTYTLTRDAGVDDDTAEAGDLDLTDDLTVSGPEEGVAVVAKASCCGGIDRLFHVPGEDTDVSFENLSFDGSLAVAPEGGGAIRNMGRVRTRFCVFTGNGGPEGGAIQNEGVLIVRRTVFQDNFADEDGGAIRSRGALVVRGSLFLRNGVGEDGGAIAAAGRLSVRSSLFERNAAEDGGALYFDSSGAQSLLIEDSVFERNAAGVAGGLYNDSALEAVVRRSRFSANGALAIFGSVRAEDSHFVANEGSDLFAQGGAILALTGSVTAIRSVFERNVVGAVDPPLGGLLGTGGAILADVVVAVDSTFEENAAEEGAAITCGTSGRIVNSTFSGNVARDLGIIACDDLDLVNSTVVRNTVQVAGGIGALAGRTARLHGSIVLGNDALSDDCAFTGAVVSTGSNVLATACADVSRAGDVLTDAVDAVVGPMQNTAGRVRTAGLPAGSPARDLVPVASCTWDDDGDPATPEVALTHDARGTLRPQGAACDAGAVEARVESARRRCGLGFESGAALMLIAALRRRRRNS